MPEGDTVPQTPLEAKSPYELRVNLGKNVPESDVRTALATGDMGFLHSFTTGSTVDGPGVRRRRVDDGLHVAVPLLPQPRHLDAQQRHPGHRRKGHRRAAQVPAWPEGHVRRLHSQRRRALDAASLRREAVHGREGEWASIRRSIPTAITATALSDDELESIDLVLLDLKTSDPERHRRLTGMDVGPTRQFAERLARRRRPIWVRYVLVPGVTDDIDDIEKTAGFAGGLGNVARVDVLPFHQMGKYKWQQLGMEYTLQDVEPPSAELVERVCAVFRAQGLKVY